MSALIMSHCVFLHAPKTGGTWVAEALRRQGIVKATLRDAAGSTHPTLATVREVLPEAVVITTVREPVSFLRSFWRFFYRRNWRGAELPYGGIPALEPLLALASPTFAEFAQRYLTRRPGYVSELMRTFADGADHVCRQEHLLEDLTGALTACGQPFIAEVLASTPRENVSRNFKADCSPAVERSIREADDWVIRNFYA